MTEKASNTSSNIGETGVKSIRLKGQRIEELPLGQGNEALSQLELARETERLNAIAEVNATYPHQRVDWLVSRIAVCEENKQRMRAFIGETMGKINEYRGLITITEVREKLLAAATDEEERKAIKKQYLPYNIDAMNEQIGQFEADIEKAEAVVDQEDASIKEFSETVALCRERDKKLAKLGAVAEGS
jgi:hypothetical protein